MEASRLGVAAEEAGALEVHTATGAGTVGACGDCTVLAVPGTVAEEDRADSPEASSTDTEAEAGETWAEDTPLAVHGRGSPRSACRPETAEGHGQARRDWGQSALW